MSAANIEIRHKAGHMETVLWPDGRTDVPEVITEHCLGSCHSSDEAAVLNHNTLGVARSARRVHDAGEVIWGRLAGDNLGNKDRACFSMEQAE